MYIADTWNQRVQVFEYNESSQSFLPSNEWVIIGWYGQSLENKPYIQVGKEGKVFISDPEGYRILEFTTDGEFIRYWGDYGNDDSSFIIPVGLAYDPSTDSIWVADSGNNRFMRFIIDHTEAP